MELNRKHFRAIIFYNFRRGLTQQQCLDELNSIFGDEDPSRTSVYLWYGEFNRGRCSWNHWCCASTDIARSSCDNLRYYIQYCMNIWLSKKFVRIRSHTICQSLKKFQSIRVTKVIRQLVQTHGKVYRS